MTRSEDVGSMNTAGLDKAKAAIHGILLFAALILVTASFPSLLWPWPLLLPLLIYAGIVSAIGPLRRTAPMPAFERMHRWPVVYTAALAVTTTLVLIGFQEIMRPDLRELAAKLPVAWFGSLLLAGVCFSVVNAGIEELIFRGILWEAIAIEWNQGTALAATTVLFGAGHLHGYPPGPIGATLAGLYGLALGVLRWWTGGLGLAIACHVGADATIFCILTGSDAFDSP